MPLGCDAVSMPSGHPITPEQQQDIIVQSIELNKSNSFIAKEMGLEYHAVKRVVRKYEEQHLYHDQ